MSEHKVGELAEVVKQEVLEALQGGATICYAPISGGLILLGKDGERIRAQISIEEFICLRGLGNIRRANTMGQGHHIFHGQVDVYKM